MKIVKWCVVSYLAFIIVPSVYASMPDTQSPKGSINGAAIAWDGIKHFFDYGHYRVIGTCIWEKGVYPPKLIPTLEIDEYEPDLVVSVYNHHGDNPWWEMRLVDDGYNWIAHSIIHALTGMSPTEGNNADIPSKNNQNSLRRKIVEVVGSPADLTTLPLMNLTPDTVSYVVYYQSQIDVLGRYGLAELLYSPRTLNPMAYYIGQSVFNHWGYEFPRNMSVSQTNDYKAALILAQRAVDIVTNHNAGHTVVTTNNRCGKKNCVVRNVIEETKESRAIWEEIYPKDRHVHIGEDDSLNPQSLGVADILAGNGNYVFLVWRRYRGCIQVKNAHLVFKSVDVGRPQWR